MMFNLFRLIDEQGFKDYIGNREVNPGAMCKAEPQNQEVMAEMSQLFFNASYMIFRVSPTFMNFFEDKLRC